MQAPGEPGRQKMNVAPATPAVARRLDRRRADLASLTNRKHRESLHPLLEQRLDRLWRHVAAGEAGAASGDDHIDQLVGDPGLHPRADFLDVVGDDAALGHDMAGGADALGQRRAGLVVGRARGCRKSSAPRS